MSESIPVPGSSGPFAELKDAASRRDFLRRASMLTLSIPGAGAMLTACAPDAADPPAADDHAMPAQVSGATLPANPPPFVRYAPELPPLSASRTIRLNWRATETPIRISEDTVVAGWTFEDNIPGPIVHCRVGDTVEFTLTNTGIVPHSMDFHAAQVDPKVAFASVAQNQSISFRFTPRYAGAFMYHCGTAPVLMHIAAGMYGAIIVSPRQPLPPAKEFVLVQSEYYFGDAVNGVRQFSYDRMLATLPDVVCFNGRPGQYIAEPIRVKVGDRVRFWVVAAGPNHSAPFTSWASSSTPSISARRRERPLRVSRPSRSRRAAGWCLRWSATCPASSRS